MLNKQVSKQISLKKKIKEISSLLPRNVHFDSIIGNCKYNIQPTRKDENL